MTAVRLEAASIGSSLALSLSTLPRTTTLQLSASVDTGGACGNAGLDATSADSVSNAPRLRQPRLNGNFIESSWRRNGNSLPFTTALCRIHYHVIRKPVPKRRPRPRHERQQRALHPHVRGVALLGARRRRDAHRHQHHLTRLEENPTRAE